METSLLVEKLQARGIQLSVGDAGNLIYDESIPTGIRTTLKIEESRIVEYLASLEPRTVDARPTYKNASAVPQSVLQKLGDAAPMFEKVLELFPPAGSIEWTSNDDLKKVRP